MQSLVECCGFNVNVLEVAPTFAGPVFGVSNSMACIPGMIGVPLNGKLLDIMGDGQRVCYLKNEIALRCEMLVH